MGLMAEVLAEMWQDLKDHVLGLARAVAFTALVYWQMRWFGLDTSALRLAVVVILAFVGAILWFVVPVPEARRTWVGGGDRWDWLEHAAPVSGATLAAWGCWAAAAAALLFLD